MHRIIGPDVSFYQDDPGTTRGIDFVRMNQVADFVIVRAGQNQWIDTDFETNWRGAKQAGLPRGSYWFYDSRADPRQQAELWVDTLNGDQGELPLFADLEEAYGGPFTGWQHWRNFLDRLRSLVGQKDIGIYTAYFYWREHAPNPTTQPNELEYFHRYPLWIANYGAIQPLVPKPWNANEWLFWQFTAMGDGLQYGVESLDIDLNYFNGDAQAFARRFNIPVPPEPPVPDPIGKKYVVNARALYVREGPGTNYRALGYLVRNDIVEAFDVNFDRTWLNIRRLSDGLTGWSSATYLVQLTVPPPPPPDIPPEAGERYRVTATRLNVREGPGTNFKIIGSVSQNEIVFVIDSNPDGSWKRMRRNNGLVGWVSGRYITPAPLPPPPPPSPPGEAGDWYRTTATRLNVRENPDTTSRILGTIPQNEVVQSLGTNTDKSWVQLRKIDGLTGWASAQYLVNVGKSPALAKQSVLRGVTYNRNERTTPRKVVSHVLVLDLRTTGLRFLVTPPIRTTLPPLCTRTTSGFLADQGLQIAINGDGFYYLDPARYNPQEYCPDGGDPVRLVGYAVSLGTEYSPKEPGRPILYINQNNQISFNELKGKLYNAISGDRMLVVKGKRVAGLEADRFDPRTAVGLNQNGRYFILAVVDGREFSEGMNFPELADLMLSHGAYTAMSLDGGGSSTMVIEGVDGQPRVLNTLIDEGIPGRERAVANHLGIFIRK